MDLEGAKKLISESGNSFQCKVVNYFRAAGWTVLLSPYYVDVSTDKTREIDLIVEKAYGVEDIWSGVGRKVIVVRLFVECKYIVHGVVFWFDAMDRILAKEWIYGNTCFTRDNSITDSHHYLLGSRPVAKLFATVQQKGDENDAMFRTVNQCISGYVHSRSRGLLLPPRSARVDVTVLNYPVVVCSDFAKFFATNVADTSNSVEPTNLRDNFLLEVNYAYLNRLNATAPTLEYFLIDVVEFSGLDGLLTSLGSEAAAAKLMVGDN
jgi:hypothetical protein